MVEREAAWPLICQEEVGKEVTHGVVGEEVTCGVTGGKEVVIPGEIQETRVKVAVEGIQGSAKGI